MYPRKNGPSDFDYPVDRLLELRGILSAEEICNPNNKDHNGNSVRYVIKHGLATLTTIGRLTGFQSHVRRYFAVGSRDSVEAAVYPCGSGSVRSPGAGALGPSLSMPPASLFPPPLSLLARA